MRDANGTRVHALLGERDWREADATADEAARAHHVELSGLVWDAARHGLRLESEVFLFTSSPGDARPTLAQRRGAGRDRSGNWYFVDATRRRVRVTSSGSGLTTDFWPVPAQPRDDDPPGAFRPSSPAPEAPTLELDALAVTADHRLVVAAHDVGVPSRTWFLVFDLVEGGPPEALIWPEGIPLRVFDMAPLPRGGLWALDRENRRLWRFNRHLRVEGRVAPDATTSTPTPGGFVSADGSAPEPAPVTLPPMRVDDAIALDPTRDFTAVEGFDRDRALLLERDEGARASSVHGVWRHGAAWGAPQRLDLSAVLPASGGDADVRSPVAHDLAFVPDADDPEGGRLYAASWVGNQAFAFALRATDAGFTLEARDDYHPMRAFTGEGLVSNGRGAWYASSHRWVPLRAQRRARFVADGTLVTPLARFDGVEPECVWHRVMVDARVPHGCALRVESRAARTLEALSAQPWSEEPPLLRRPLGAELPWATAPTDAREGTWELLLQRARGRYLQLRLTVTGDGTASPTIRAVRAWSPRFSYLARYLPAVYREDAASASFLERFMANAEGTLTTLEDRIAAAQVLFDARTAGDEFLPWLLGWFGAGEEVLPDARRRRIFLRHAMRLYRARGTAWGILAAVRLALDADATEASVLCPDVTSRGGPRVVEHFRFRGLGAARAGDPSGGDGEPVVPRTVATAVVRASRVRGSYRVALARAAQGRLYTPPAAFPLVAPAEPWMRAVWESVAREALGIVPTLAADTSPRALARWRDFLRRRHRTPAALRVAHGAAAEVDFAAVPLPVSLPATPGAFRDWYDYEVVVLSRARRAHRFSLLLPMRGATVEARREARSRRAVAERVVALQKPAHTTFDVRFYWSLFRVGEARLGHDTALELSAREALALAVTDESYLGESRLAARDDADGDGCRDERLVLGRPPPGGVDD